MTTNAGSRSAAYRTRRRVCGQHDHADAAPRLTDGEHTTDPEPVDHTRGDPGSDHERHDGQREVGDAGAQGAVVEHLLHEQRRLEDDTEERRGDQRRHDVGGRDVRRRNSASGTRGASTRRSTTTNSVSETTPTARNPPTVGEPEPAWTLWSTAATRAITPAVSATAPATSGRPIVRRGGSRGASRRIMTTRTSPIGI